MGKDKTGQRTKNNARPSSSGRTAEMLGSAPINPFLSFSSLKEGFGVDDKAPDPNVDPNFQLLLKKMCKKDPLTKLKALQEFCQLCNDSEADTVMTILSFWPRLYSTLAFETDHRIREAAQLAHSAVLSKVKRNIAPYLKCIAGPWFVAQCDTYAPAACIASQAFKDTFPGEKLSKAIAHCQEQILNYIFEIVIVHTPQSLCNSKTMTPEEMESKYFRTLTSSLQGYSLYLQQLTSEQLHSVGDLNKKLVSDPKFWKYCKHQSPQVRSAWFNALSSLCQHGQFLLEGEEQRVALAVFNALDESEASVLPAVWEAALVALVVLDGLWGAVSFDKLVLPKLLRVCREAGSGCASVIFPSLLPLLSKMPPDVLHDPQAFYQKFFGCIRQGFTQRTVQQSVSESKAVANSFVECLQYVVQKHLHDRSFCSELLHQHLLPGILSTLTEPQWKSHVCDALYSSVTKLLHTWGKSPEDSILQELLTEICRKLSNAMTGMITCYTSPAASGQPSCEISDSQTVSDSTDHNETQKLCTSSENIVVESSLPLCSLLKRQVNVLIQLLKSDARPQKVKFDDEPSGSSEVVNDVPNDCCEITVQKISAVGSDLCCCYLKAAKDTQNCDFLSPLVTLVQTLRSEQLFLAMARAVGLACQEALFPNLLALWLKPDSVFLNRSVVTLSSLLLCYLPPTDQMQLLECLLQDDPDPVHLLWLVEEGFSQDGAVAPWIRSSNLALPLKSLTERAIVSDEKQSVWILLSLGSGIAKDGEHVFCCEVLRAVMDVIVEQMNKIRGIDKPLSSWVSHALDILKNIIVEQSPFFLSLSNPQIPLAAVFQVSLMEPQDAPDVPSICNVWKDGSIILAKSHGPTSARVLALCSALKEHIQMLLSEKKRLPLGILQRIAFQLHAFVMAIVSCVPCDDSIERTNTCVLIVNELLGPSDMSSGVVREAHEITESLKLFQTQRKALQMLANWVHPIHIKSDDFEDNPSSSQLDLVAVACWGVVAATLLQTAAERLIHHPGDCRTCETSQRLSGTANKIVHGDFGDEIFIDIFLLFSDVKCVVDHYSSTELGSALQESNLLLSNSCVRMISHMKADRRRRLHNVFKERASSGAAWQRAHTLWHAWASLPDTCLCVDPGRAQDPPSADSPIEDVDLSPLDWVSAHVINSSQNSSVKHLASQWLNCIHRLHVLQGHRLLLSGGVETSSPAVIVDAYRVMVFLDALLTHSHDLLEGRNWDQVMVAIASWIHSAHTTVVSTVGKTDSEHQPSSLFCVHLRGLCRLFVTLNKVVQKMKDGELKQEGLDESIPREWSDVFAGECEHKLLAIWTAFVENLGTSGACPLYIATLDELGVALQHSTLAFLMPSKGAPVQYGPLLTLAPQFLLHSLSSVRLAAYHLLLKIVPHMVQSDAEKLAAVTTKVESGEIPVEYAERLTLPGFEDVLVPAQTIVTTMLIDIRLGSSCTVQPFTDAYTYTAGYLLVWSLVLEMCKAAETELRYQYAMWLRNSSPNYVEVLLNNVFRLLPDAVLQVSDSRRKPFAEYFSRKPRFEFGDSWSSWWIETLACSVFLEALGRLPALARQWWTDCEPKAATLIDRVVSEYVSPLLCAEELAGVAKMQDKAVDNMVVRVHPAVREVVATYTVDDTSMDLVVRLPTNHPLSPMSVETGAAGQWRMWLMQLTHQNGTLWDGLALWRNNVVRKYEGVEECYICFCVLSGPSLQLPKLSCRTCRKKFHSNCLYKWFQTSNKSTCPICRNLF